ncbi:MAG: gene transfer agent family protein [Pseudomonadota bacterium]
MGPNRARAEVEAVIDGEPRVLKLTLGALSALEASLDPPDLIALIERFEAGRPTAKDVVGVISAGLAGGGVALAPDADGPAVEGGVAGAYRLAAELLTAAFADSP